MFASMLKLKTFSDAVILLAFQELNNVFCVYTEVIAQDETVTIVPTKSDSHVIFCLQLLSI